MGRRDPFPTELVRDLIGIARVLYVTIQRVDPNDPRLARLEEIGQSLRIGLRMGSQCDQADTIGTRAGWDRAEEATKALGEMIGDTLPVSALLVAVGAKLNEIDNGPRVTRETRDEKRLRDATRR